jgi:hypothetical protein
MMAFGMLFTAEQVIVDQRVSSGRNPTQAEVRQWLAT